MAFMGIRRVEFSFTIKTSKNKILRFRSGIMRGSPLFAQIAPHCSLRNQHLGGEARLPDASRKADISLHAGRRRLPTLSKMFVSSKRLRAIDKKFLGYLNGRGSTPARQLGRYHIQTADSTPH